MPHVVSIGNCVLGAAFPVFITAEIGINHNGDIDIAKRLIDAAYDAGCNAVKFQKRTPEKCVPQGQWGVLRTTPWGVMPYIEYRLRLEFGVDAYKEINEYCREKRLLWFASCWDEEAVEFMAGFDPPCYKVPSACLTKDGLLHCMRAKGRPVILSTGMSTLEQVDHAVSVLGLDDLVILQCTSSYPAANEEVNLRVIDTYKKRYDCPVGYSGHEKGVLPSLAAVALGARYVERHITLDREMWGSDQKASLEPGDFKHLVQCIREIEIALGDGVKRTYESERERMIRLRA